MKTKAFLLSAFALAVGFSAAPALAQDDHDVCLVSNDIKDWQLVDPHTLLVTDSSHRSYTVKVKGPQCGNLDMAEMQVVFHNSMHEGCLMRGDKVRYEAPSFGRTSCVVSSVERASRKPAATVKKNL